MLLYTTHLLLLTLTLAQSCFSNPVQALSNAEDIIARTAPRRFLLQITNNNNTREGYNGTFIHEGNDISKTMYQDTPADPTCVTASHHLY